MTHDEFEQHEHAARDVIQQLRRVTGTTKASPDFMAGVLARAEREAPPRRGVKNWLATALLWPASFRTTAALAVCMFVALLGAIPQYYAWINAYVIGVSPTLLQTARLQEELWKKNFTCATQLDHDSTAYASLTDDHVNVVVWACPSGDVLVVMGTPAEPSSRRSVWVPLQTPAASSDFFSWLVRRAFAEGLPPDSFQVAQVTRVLCQKWLPDKRIKRRVQLSNGECRDEIINPRTGQVQDKGPAPCDPSC